MHRRPFEEPGNHVEFLLATMTPKKLPIQEFIQHTRQHVVRQTWMSGPTHANAQVWLV